MDLAASMYEVSFTESTTDRTTLRPSYQTTLQDWRCMPTVLSVPSIVCLSFLFPSGPFGPQAPRSSAKAVVAGPPPVAPKHYTMDNTLERSYLIKHGVGVG